MSKGNLMKLRERARNASLLVTTILLTACVGQRSSPVSPVELPSIWNTTTASEGSVVAVDWWQEFEDQNLDRLVRRVLESNTKVLTAADHLRKARYEAASMSTNSTPDVDVRAGVDWGSDRFAQDRMRSDGGTINATLRYDLDVGGKLAAQRDAAESNVSAVESDGDSNRLQIIKESLVMYWKLGFLSESLKFAGEGLARAKKTSAIVKARYGAGDVSKTDVVQAQQNVITRALAIDRLNEQVTKNRNALAILMGQPPETTVSLPDALPFKPLRPIAAGLPADVIRRRSDVLAAEWRLRQACANINVTRSDLYPSLTLTSSVGTSSASLERFLSSPITNLGLAIALPFIQWNQTKLRIKISEVDFDVAAHHFRATVYSALREVEDELTTGARLERQEAQLLEQLENARRAAHLAEVRFVAGETTVQPLLQGQQSLMEAQEAVTQNHLDRLTNRAALLVALGGGTKDPTQG